MAITVVQEAMTTGTHNASSVASASMTVTAGNTLLVRVGHGSSQTISSIGDGGTHTYAPKSAATYTAQSHRIAQYSATNLTAGSYTVTANFSAGTQYPWIFLSEISGAAASGIDGTNANYQPSPTSTSTDGILSTATNSNQPTLIHALLYGPSGPSVGTSFTLCNYGSNAGGNSGYNVDWITERRRITSTGSQSATWTNGYDGNSIYSDIMMVNEATAGGGRIIGGSLVGGVLLGVLAK